MAIYSTHIAYYMRTHTYKAAKVGTDRTGFRQTLQISVEPICRNLAATAVKAMGQAYPREPASFCMSQQLHCLNMNEYIRLLELNYNTRFM